MGDTHRDPIDHHRTTLPHSGATFKDSYLLPGLTLLMFSVVAVAGGLASVGYMHIEMAAVVACAALILGVAGASLIALERRRVRQIEKHWQAEDSTLPRVT